MQQSAASRCKILLDHLVEHCQTVQKLFPFLSLSLSSFNMLSADIFPSHLPFCSSITLWPSLHHITIKTPRSDTPGNSTGRRPARRSTLTFCRGKTNVVCKIEWRGGWAARKGVKNGQAKSPQWARFCHLSSVEFALNFSEAISKF